MLPPRGETIGILFIQAYWRMQKLFSSNQTFVDAGYGEDDIDCPKGEVLSRTEIQPQNLNFGDVFLSCVRF